MNICVDFDGTCVKNAFPSAGAEIGAVPVLKELVANGHNFYIIWIWLFIFEPPSIIIKSRV